jgi:predicted esterase YcpF (UPF0227 family)
MSAEKHIHKESNSYLIVCFSGNLNSKFMGGQLFEFHNYLSKTYTNVDLSFFIERHKCFYHMGIDGVTKTIDETALYLTQLINAKNYKHVIFMGCSAGGYASILFGSLCHVDTVIAFIPQTTYKSGMTVSKYYDLKNVINKSTKYIVHGDVLNIDKNDLHNIYECYNISEFKNVHIIEHKNLNMKKLRDQGYIKIQIDSSLPL